VPNENSGGKAPRGGASRGDRNRDGPGGRGKDRGRGGKGDKRGGRDRDEGSGSTYRVVAELPLLEKALSTQDFSKQREPLESILKALKPLRLSSLEQLDMNTRGRLLTTLLRIQRQTKPAPSAPEAAAAGASETPPASEAPPA
jgi:hypothetical protein